MKGIIVGVDESAYANTALRWAVDYGVDRNLPVTALMAWDFVQQHHLDPAEGFDSKYDAEVATKVLHELVTRAVGAHNDVTELVVCDRAGHALIEAAGVDASLVVVGARGMSGFRGLMLGSVSRYVLHAATGPVAVIRTSGAHPEAPVVVGLDGSEPSRQALAWSISYARARKLPIIALHAWMPEYNPIGMWTAQDPRNNAVTAAKFLDDELAGVDDSGLVAPIERHLKEDRPSAALLEAGCVASILVVGSRGRPRVANSLLGSVSDQVSHYATCPVVVVP
jgi:nucleotide-binding universal stress UspA family protein